MRSAPLLLCITAACTAQDAAPRPARPPNLVVIFVDDMGSALLAAGIGAVLLVLVGNYLLVAAARAHAWVAASLLRQAVDPLAAAKQLLVDDPALSRG